jgi:hypothetical protein
MHRIVEVKPLPHYLLWLRFQDGVEGEVSLANLVGKGVFALWNDPEQFRRVSIDAETHTVVWPGGIDLCPDRLYQDLAGSGQG